jgi:hypothetical protein
VRTPYNGLANSPRPYLLHGINQLRSPQVPLVGQKRGYSADANAPQYAPRRAEAPLLTHKPSGQFVPPEEHAMSAGLSFEPSSTIAVEAG